MGIIWVTFLPTQFEWLSLLEKSIPYPHSAPKSGTQVDEKKIKRNLSFSTYVDDTYLKCIRVFAKHVLKCV